MIDELVFSILNLNSDLIGNINGDLKLSLINIEHELIRDGYIAFNIDQKINLNKIVISLDNIGIVDLVI